MQALFEGLLESRQRRLGILFVAAGALCVWQLWAFHSVRHDDPFITYRYGQNLASGDGLSFNPGVRFLGATSPAHIFVSAIVYALFDIDATPPVIAALGCLAWSAQALAVFLLFVSSLGALGASTVALLVDLGGAESYKWVPFETNLAMACALWALVSFQRSRHLLAATLLGFGALFRPELALLAALVFGSYALQRTRAGLRALWLFSAVIGSWIVFAVAYYGSPLPHSALTKFQRTTLSEYATHAVVHIGQVVVPFVPGIARSVCAGVACVLGAIVLCRKDRTLLVLALFTLLHVLAFTLFLRPFVQHTWHLYPFVLGGALFAAGGLCWLSRYGSSKVIRVAAAVAMSSLIAGAALRSFRASGELSEEYWTGQRDAVYRGVAHYLRERLPRQEEFASVEVGTIAYYSERVAYDLGGLITDLQSDAMAQHPVRFIVLDKMYLSSAPKRPPVHVVSEGQFSAYIYELR